MKEKTQTKGSAISGLFTMLLFLVFVLCALFSVLMGSRVYENIIKRSDANFSGTTAISYIANKNTITLQTLGEGAAGLKLSLRSGGKDANEQK